MTSWCVLSSDVSLSVQPHLGATRNCARLLHRYPGHSGPPRGSSTQVCRFGDFRGVSFLEPRAHSIAAYSTADSIVLGISCSLVCSGSSVSSSASSPASDNGVGQVARGSFLDPELDPIYVALGAISLIERGGRGKRTTATEHRCAP